MKTSETISKIASALLQAQSVMGNASKGASNPYFKSSYADLNSIREVVTGPLNSNKITLLQPTTYVDGKAFVETILLHESGEFVSGLTEIVVAKVNDPQAMGSAISYARRYGLQSFLSVGAVDDDSEAAMGRKSNNPSPAQLKYESKKQEVRAEVLTAPTSAAPVVQAVVTEPIVPKKKSMFTKPGSTSNGQASTSSDDSWT